MNTNRHEVLRILDVNFNRAREATRVIEDYTRFVLDNKFLSTELRNIRHKLTNIVGAIHELPLLSARNVQDDVGRESVSNTSNITEVITANFKRLQESLRSLAEYTKQIKPRITQITQEIEQLRFKSYELEQQLTIYLFPNKTFQGVRLYVLVSTDIIHQPLIEIVKQVIRGGADAIQLREKSMPDKVLLDMARKIRKVTLKHNVLFIVNDRVDIALLSNADGVHLGKDDIPIHQTRKILGADKIIGATSHNIKEALEAQKTGADYISVGPIFPSPTKPHLKPEGLGYLKEVARKIKIPYVAIGGINYSNLPQLLKVHKRLFKCPLKIAVASAIFTGANTRQAVRHLYRNL